MRHSAVPLNVIAFESDNANAAYLRANALRYITHRRKLRHDLTLVDGFVNATTIGPDLRRMGVRTTSFSLLKIDIDSADLAVATAIVEASLRPVLIWAEHNQHVPLPIEFAALEPVSGETLRPTYGYGSSNFTGYRGANSVWPCFGASLAAWGRFAHRHNYVVRATRGNNVLLMRSDAHARARYNDSSDDLWCHARTTHGQTARLKTHMFDVRNAEARAYFQRARSHFLQAPVPGLPPLAGRTPTSQQHQHQHLDQHQQRQQRWLPEAPDTFDYRSAVTTIEKRCRENQTPFLLSINGECCPGRSIDRDAPQASRPGQASGVSLNQHARSVQAKTTPPLPAAYKLCRGCWSEGEAL